MVPHPLAGPSRGNVFAGNSVTLAVGQWLTVRSLTSFGLPAPSLNQWRRWRPKNFSIDVEN